MRRVVAIAAGAVVLIAASPTGPTAYDRQQDARIAALEAEVAALTPSPTPAPTPSPPSGFYGMGIGSDSLANTQVGGTSCGCPNLASSYRFRAGQSAALNSVRIYITDGAGYAGGNGGTVRVSVQADASGVPSGTDLAAATFASGNPVSIGYLPLVTFPSPTTLTAGQVYHVVFRNIDPAPTVNYVSIDSLFTYGAAVTQPRIPTGTWSQLLNTGSGWTTRTNFDPILALNYANGVTEGQGYMEVWVNAPKSISGSAKVREVFTPSQSVTVSEVGARLRRPSGSSPLTLTLNGVSATIPAASVPVGASDRGSAWVSAPLATTLSAGVQYQLVLSSPADTVYSAFGIERGNNYGFASSTYFADGFGQYSLDGSTWSGFDQPGGSRNNTNADVQWYAR